MNSLNTKALLIGLVTIGMISVQGAVFADNNDGETRWVLTGDSPLLDRSSKYMFKGNNDAGIKYAVKALARSQSKYTRLIASHNLCIAYAAEGEMVLAAEYCAVARDASIPDTSLKQIKPGLYKVARKTVKTTDATSLYSVITQNLEINGLGNDLPRVARAN